MDLDVLTARLIHVVGGIFWVGAFIFVNFFLAPSLVEAGPDGAKVMSGVMKRRYMPIMMTVAMLTILSGVWLYWKASMGFSVVYMKSGPGHAYAIGGLLSVLAFVIGVSVTRPSMTKAMDLAQRASAPGVPDRDSLLVEAQRLRSRGTIAGKVVTVLILLAAVLMAIGRYL